MLYRIKLIFSILSSCMLLEATAQNWDSLSCGIQGGDPYCMYADSADNFVYIGGFFPVSGSSMVGGLVRWDGSSFDAMNYTGMDRYVRAITRFNDTIYAAGQFWSIDQHIAKWNGSSWDSIGRVNNGGAFNLVPFNNELYAVGVFDSINNSGGNNIVKWNGASWSNLKDTTFNGIITSMAVFGGEIYIGGNFYNISKNIWKIMKWNGTNYVPLSGGGIVGGGDQIDDMVVYDNELYVSGTFKKSSGNVGNYIQKWDGTSWTEVGGGVMGLSGGNGQIHDMKTFGNDLYVVGVFSTAGGVPAQFVAKWDGTDWCGFGSTFNNILTALCFKNGELYVGGGFDTVDTDNVNHVAKWIGASLDTCGHINVGIDDISSNNSLWVYPNPASDQITIEFELAGEKRVVIEIKNVLGQTIKTLSQRSVKGNTRVTIDLDEFSSGLYCAQLIYGDNISVKKFVKN